MSERKSANKFSYKFEAFLSKFVSIGPISLWMILLVLVPLIYIVFISFMQRSDAGEIIFKPTLDNYITMKNPIYFKVFIDSLNMAFTTTVLVLALGYPFAYFVARVPKKFRVLAMMLIIVPFWTNSLIRTYAWMSLLSTEGLINNFLIKIGIIKEPLKMLYTYGAVLVGMVYTLLPFMVLPLYNSIEKMDRTYLEAARDLGASSVKAFLTITVPLTMPGIVAGCILVFIPSVGLFFISDLMGGSKVMLIGSLIRNQFSTARNWPFGAALSIVMIVLSLVLIGIYIKLVGRKVDMEVF
ncbi:ABC transporter permease [Clostridium oryzae]|uniref:Spermidine/putrescine transport system permease protein PotB n=1 Tax=Clostridium oryzae TaxID=1450648 RepID=A0A1V4I996_9CLOT|nr:ABC transporter permease subunit [Clostridium oryzae]OPJ56185.1 spermidine/putrescine transport system permease protein PotB [Clostridium oryzae]